MPQQKVLVTRKALIQRINRHLAKSGKKLKKARHDARLGFFIVGKKVEAADIDLEEYGRNVGLLQDWEEVK